MNIQGWFPLVLTGLILQSKGLLKVFSSSTVQKHKFFSSQPSLWSNSHSHTSVQFSNSVVSNSLCPHGLQHTRPPCPSPTLGACSNSCPSSWWCYPSISASVISSFCLQSFPASGSFLASQFFTSGGQSIGVLASASVLPMNIQDCFPSGWTGCISLQSKGHSKVFSNTTVQNCQFFGTQIFI